MQALAKEWKIGKEKIRAIMKNLQSAGYADLRIVRDEGTGKVKGKQWIVYERPQLGSTEEQEIRLSGRDRETGNPDVGEKPTSVKPGQLLNTEVKDYQKLNSKPKTEKKIASEFQGTHSPSDPAKGNGRKIAHDELPDDFPSLLEIARTLPEKYPPYKKSPRAKKLTYHPNWYTVCQKGMDILRGARDTGTGYSISFKYLKQAFESGYTPEQWLSCAKRLFELRAQGEKWAQYVQPATVNKMLPHFVANGLRGSAPRNVYRGESLATKLREVE